jgi:predicted Rossmann-fold nucleotide-binding protein
MVTLVQTGKIKKVPIILVGADYWQNLQDFIQQTLLKRYKTINHSDLDLYHMTDDEDEVVQIVEGAPMRKE